MKIKDYSIEKILEIGEKNGIMVFGTGKVLKYMIDLFPKIQSLIIGSVDNDINKQGTFFEYNEVHTRIYSVDTLIKWENDDFPIVLITTADVYGVFSQMNSKDELKDRFCCCYHMVLEHDRELLEEKRIYPQVSEAKKTVYIPRIIHYCWFGNRKPSNNEIRYIESWKRYCPDYKIMFWNEENYDVNQRKYTREAYERKAWAFVSDVARLDIVYEYGGIYLDTDVEIIRSFDDLLFEKSFFALESNGHIATGLGFGAEKKSKIVGELRQLYDNRHFINKDNTEDRTPCPIIQSRLFKDKGYNGDGNYYKGNGFVIYPRRMFSPKSFETGIIRKSDSTYSIHHFDMSWHDNETKEKYRNLYKLPDFIEDD